MAEVMTQRDVRDIAAYWNAPCINAWVSLRSLGDPRRINASVMESLEANASPGLKVTLRPIASLTDDEVRECARLTCIELNRPVKVAPITRESYITYSWIHCGPLNITHSTGNASFLQFIYENEMPFPTGAIISYLQSIAVYVPGTIDEKYVNLVE